MTIRSELTSGPALTGYALVMLVALLIPSRALGDGAELRIAPDSPAQGRGNAAANVLTYDLNSIDPPELATVEFAWIELHISRLADTEDCIVYLTKCLGDSASDPEGCGEDGRVASMAEWWVVGANNVRNDECYVRLDLTDAVRTAIAGQQLTLECTLVSECGEYPASEFLEGPAELRVGYSRRIVPAPSEE